MRRILFLINPVAGKGTNKELIDDIEKFFINEEVTIIISEYKGEIEKITREYLNRGYTDFISVGGDGSFSEMINGIEGNKVRIGLIPAGTGNDFSRIIDMPENLIECLKIIKNMKTINIDSGKINNKKFINVACFGIDGQIIKDTEKIKKYIPGSLAYILSTIKALLFYSYAKLFIEVDGKIYNEEIILVAVGNGKFIGGGMKVAPEANLDDGYLDLCIVRKMKKFNTLRLFHKIFTGMHIEEDKVEYIKCKNINLKSENKLKIDVNLDGNLSGYLPAQISIQENSYQLIVPESLWKEHNGERI